MLWKAWNCHETLIISQRWHAWWVPRYLISGLVPLDPRGDKGDNINLPAVAGGDNFNLPAVAGGEVPRGSS